MAYNCTGSSALWHILIDLYFAPEAVQYGIYCTGSMQYGIYCTVGRPRNMLQDYLQHIGCSQIFLSKVWSTQTQPGEVAGPVYCTPAIRIKKPHSCCLQADYSYVNSLQTIIKVIPALVRVIGQVSCTCVGFHWYRGVT